MSNSDFEILQSCLTGKSDGFSVLYDKYIDTIYRFVYLKVYDAQVAEDITSDVFYKALKKIESYNPEKGASFKTWLFTIANNTVIDYYRTKKEHVQLEDMLDTLYEDYDMGKKLDDKESVKKILIFLDSMPKKVREVMIYRFWNDMSFKEIAEVTGENVDNCKKIVSRTIAKMDPEMFLLFLLFINF